MMHNYRSIPKAQGLYDPAHEHDACGVGFVVNIKGERSHDIVAKGLQVLDNLTHRGACGCDPRTGDGAGILLQIPHDFFASEAERLGFKLPAPGEYGVGQVFLPLDAVKRRECEDAFERIVNEEGQRLLGWRDVPVVESACGDIARRGMPAIRQVFIARSADVKDAEALERKLYVIRKRATSEAEKLGLFDPELFYFCSLSALTVVYKGQLISTQIPQFFPDLLDRAVKTALAMVHQRFSTNTFPSWDRAHPYRFMSHNGEINTLRGNINWMHAREKLFSSPLFGDDIKKLLPIVEPNGSDSAMFDNCLELLIRTGRSTAARRYDDDSGSVAERRADERQQTRLLPLSFLHDGAVGRSRVDRVHRRHPNRRGARSQRPSSLALHGDQGRTGRDGVRDRACSTSRRRTLRSRDACSRAECSSSILRSAESFRTKRSSSRWRRDSRIARGSTAVSSHSSRFPRQAARLRLIALKTTSCSGNSSRSATRSRISK